jgi:hypothetical protein
MITKLMSKSWIRILPYDLAALPPKSIQPISTLQILDSKPKLYLGFKARFGNKPARSL